MEEVAGLEREKLSKAGKEVLIKSGAQTILLIV